MDVHHSYNHTSIPRSDLLDRNLCSYMSSTQNQWERDEDPAMLPYLSYYHSTGECCLLACHYDRKPLVMESCQGISYNPEQLWHNNILIITVV